MKRSIFSFAATLSLVGGSHAAILVDNFESYSPLFGDMNGNGSWIVSNGIPAIPAEGPVVILDAYTWDASAQSATVGGVQSTLGGVTSMYNSSFGVPLVSVTPQPTYFEIETAYTESTVGQRNNFSFVLNATSGNLLTLTFTPSGGPTQYDVSWSSAFATGALIGSLSANTPTQFRLNTFASGANVAYSLTNAGTPVSSGLLVGASASDVINSFAVNWDSASNGGLGNNSITIDNISVVPEPSSALLGLLGASFAFLRRRRA